MAGMTFDGHIDHLLDIEGGFVDDARDSGGATRWGITEALARQYGYEGPMAELPQEKAKSIYATHFWDALMLDRIAELRPAVAFKLFQQAVHAGRGQAVKWLQRSLNALNQRGEWWPDTTVDGLMGPRTIAAFFEFMRRRSVHGETVLLRALNGLQTAHYINLAEAREKDEAFVFGWIKNRCL